MSEFHSVTIVDAINNMQSGKYLLPSFQREYVWRSEQVECLFDSLMRGYPINSMLFWAVRDSARSNYRFYRFISRYVERYHTHNEEFCAVLKEEFFAVLDGQQRLTSLFIGLCGTYASHKLYARYDNSEVNYPTRYLFLCLTKNSNVDEREYDFRFLVKSPSCNDIFTDKDGRHWFRVGAILAIQDILDFAVENQLTRDERKVLARLKEIVFDRPVINYYEEGTDNPDVAVNIFVRINSGGTSLNYADILLSMVIANWNGDDARNEIRGLVDVVNSKGFNISHDYILKAFLYLYHRDVRFRIKSFSNEFLDNIRANWNSLRESITELFDLLGSFGFDQHSLTSYYATLPILHYIYTHDIYHNFSRRMVYESDRAEIKCWLIKALLLKTFGYGADSVLHNARVALVENPCVQTFPSSIIDKSIRSRDIDNDIIDELLLQQIGGRYTFSLLALLYPNLDYANRNFHIDHMHSYAECSRCGLDKSVFNSVLNLQMLDAYENMTKQDMPLEEWVDAHSNDRERFLREHLIPDIDLSIENFDAFISERRKILSERLRALL